MDLSIVIAHYNDSNHLINLFSTIPQNKGIEIIVVDDDSDIEHLTIVEQLIKRTVGAKLFYNRGKKGPGAARNMALNEITKKYFVVADSDDVFLDEAFNILCKYIESDKEYDLVIFPPETHSEVTGVISKRGEKNKKRIIKYLKNPSKRNLLGVISKMNSTPNKLYRTALIMEEEIKYGEELVSEDIYFITRVMVEAVNIVIEENSIYSIAYTGKSLTTSKPVESFAVMNIDAAIWKKKYLKKNIDVKNSKYYKDNLNYWILYLLKNNFKRDFKKEQLDKMLKSKMLTPIGWLISNIALITL